MYAKGEEEWLDGRRASVMAGPFCAHPHRMFACWGCESTPPSLLLPPFWFLFFLTCGQNRKDRKMASPKKKPRKAGKDEGIDWTNVKIKEKGGREGRGRGEVKLQKFP
jgi:hypothetical protein